ISRHRLACAAASPLATVCPSGPSGAVPDTATIDPTRTAREIPTRGSYGLPLEINRLFCIFERLANYLLLRGNSRSHTTSRHITRLAPRTTAGRWADSRPHSPCTPHRLPS